MKWTTFVTCLFHGALIHSLEGQKVNSHQTVVVSTEEFGKTNTSTLPEVKLGERCQSDSQCPGYPKTSSRCHTVCGCISGYINIGVDDCREVSNFIGSQCEFNEQCQAGAPGFHSQCIDLVGQNKKTCDCLPGYVHGMFSYTCYPIAMKEGDNCSKNEQCVPNLQHSFCSSGTCKCVLGTHSYNGSACLPEVGLAESCEHSLQCDHIQHSACINKTCTCEVGYMEFNGSCIRRAIYVGDPCHIHDDQCQSVLNSVCDSESKKCKCKDVGYVSSLDDKSCVPLRWELNSPCSDPVQCRIANSRCIYPTCQCRDGYVQSGIKKCVQIMRLVGDSCELDEQCKIGLSGQGVCGEGLTCQCPGNLQFFDDDCYFPASKGEACQKDQECQVVDENTECESQKCVSSDSARPTLSILGVSLLFVSCINSR